MTLDLQQKGREDFAAGRKDEEVYTGSASYRAGWQLARLSAPGHCDACAPEFACWAHGNGCRKAPVSVSPTSNEEAKTDIGEISPNAANFDFNEAPSPTPPDARTEARSPAGVEIPAQGGTTEHPTPTREDVRLAVGEDKPIVPRGTMPDGQLALF